MAECDHQLEYSSLLESQRDSHHGCDTCVSTGGSTGDEDNGRCAGEPDIAEEGLEVTGYSVEDAIILKQSHHQRDGDHQTQEPDGTSECRGKCRGKRIEKFLFSGHAAKLRKKEESERVKSIKKGEIGRNRVKRGVNRDEN